MNLRGVLSNWELFAGSPQAVPRLRELILQLAVQGKLVPQDPKDEPASELLKKIRAEKERLVKEGKIKRDKPLAEIEEEEKPFELPKSWAWVRLGEITNYGATTKAGALLPTTWVLDMEDIEKSSGRLLQRIRFSERPALSDKNCFVKGDVLYGKLRPYLNKVIVADEDGICTTEIIPFRCYGDFEPRYFQIALSSPLFLDYVNARSYGMKMPRLGTEDARHAVLALPPLAEQSRIVARVQELMQLCDALEAKVTLEAQQHETLLRTLLATLTQSASSEDLAHNWQRVSDHFPLLLDRPQAIDALEQTILQLAVRGLLVPQNPTDEPASQLLKKIRTEKDKLIQEGKIKRDKPLPPIAEDEQPFELPKAWEWVRLGQIADNRLGKMLDKVKNTGQRYPYLRNTNVQWRQIDLDDIKEISLESSELDEFRLIPGDLLVCEGGYPGRCAIWNEPEREMYFQKALHRVRPRVGIPSELIAICLESDSKAGNLDKHFTGATIKHFVGQALERYLVPLPPLPEQHRIVTRVTELRQLCAALRSRLAQSSQIQAQFAQALVSQQG